MIASFDLLMHPLKPWSRPAVLTRPCPVPNTAGIYAWYFRAIPPDVPIDDCHMHDGLTLLYVGIAPSREQARTRCADESGAIAPTMHLAQRCAGRWAACWKMSWASGCALIARAV